MYPPSQTHWCLALVALSLVACGDESDSGPAPPTGWMTLPQTPYRTLSEWGLFSNYARQTPTNRVVAYEVNSPLFSDFTAKFRFVAVPPGRTIRYRAEGPWELPEGTVLVKTFAYPRDARNLSLGYRLLETRLLVRTREGYIPHTYVYNEAGTEAVRQVAAPSVQVSWIDEAGATRNNEYLIPNTNQCLTCHGQLGLTIGLGLRTDQMHRAGQIDALAAAGFFAEAPPPAAMRRAFPAPDDATAPVEARARGYLHANCGHCHNPRDRSTASGTGLNLEISETTPSNLGACRRPAMAGSGSGGLDFDVVPGHPERSVMLFRMRSTDPRARMPSLGLNFNHEAGAALIERWIREMPGDPCTPSP